ncbi:MAG: hypothetical protein IJ326_02185 [Lachnospiraceae bacterium]|nr:hypothetical protein [Lachnospiraceae bacterium]
MEKRKVLYEKKYITIISIMIIILVLLFALWKQYWYAPTVSQDIECLQKIIVHKYIRETQKYEEIIIDDSKQREHIYNLMKNAKHSYFIHYIDDDCGADEQYYIYFIYTDGADRFRIIARNDNRWHRAIYDEKGMIKAYLEIICDELTQYLNELDM